jgi:hypothetical protein
MEVTDQLHVPAALLPGIEPLVPIVQVGPRSGLDAVKKKQISCPCRKSSPDS